MVQVLPLFYNYRRVGQSKLSVTSLDHHTILYTAIMKFSQKICEF